MKIGLASYINKSPLRSKGRCFLLHLVILGLLSFTQNSYAGVDAGPGRVRHCVVADQSQTEVDTPSGFEMFSMGTNSKDIEFVVTNTTCIAVMASSYAAVKLGIAAMNAACGSGSAVPRIRPSPFHDVFDLGKASLKALSVPICGPAVTAGSIALTNAIAQMGIIFGLAKPLYENTSICGSNWMAASNKTYSFSIPKYKNEVQLQITKWLNGGSNTDKLSLTNKTYREWFYDGVEVEDNPSSGTACLDPTSTVTSPYPKQKYYLKGLQPGNYNCQNYFVSGSMNDPAIDTPTALTAERAADFKTAYDCCNSRAKGYICIKDYSRKTFCKAGEKCKIGLFTYETSFRDNDRMICAETYSLCPYNFAIGGGSEYCDYYRDGIWNETSGTWDMITAQNLLDDDCSANSVIRNSNCTYNSKANRCKNHCQYLTHCTQTSAVYPYRSGITSPYFSEACLDFIGDSQNKAAFKGGVILGNQKHFSAPIAQCVKETLENVFYNRAGHSKCLNLNEYPSKNGVCPSGSYMTEGTFIFKKGNKVKDNSFFETIQSNLQLLIKLVLTLSIVFYGMNLLIGKADIRSKKDILVYFIKIAVVLYFSTGQAWQTQFFDGIYGASSELSRMVFKIKVGADENKRDGCQFGRIYLEDGTETASNVTYPEGKEYLSMWDTLDCKLMRYLGFGPEASVANIALLILASFLTGPIGIYFALSVMIFGILLLAATIRALHIFISSSISIIIMVFVSPIIFPMMLFERTKGIFDGWLRELISFAIQPMILFAYLAIFIMVMDQTLVGSANFKGDSPFKTMDCSERCINISDKTRVADVAGVAPACDQAGEKMIDPYEDSVACLISVDEFGRFPGFEAIGLVIPIATNLFTGDIKAKVLTLLQAVLVMFLLYKFMDEIPGITNALIGGTALPGAKADALSMFKKTLGAAKGVQERVARGSKQAAKGTLKSARKGISNSTSKGKKVDEGEDDL